MNVADWIAAHQGGQQHITDPAPQAYDHANPNAAFMGGGMMPQGFFGNLAGLMSGGPMPGLQAWRARREAAGLPFRGGHMHQGLTAQPTMGAQPFGAMPQQGSSCPQNY